MTEVMVVAGTRTAIGDYGGSARGKQFTRQVIDNLTVIRGPHTLKTGFDFANFRSDQQARVVHCTFASEHTSPRMHERAT